METISLRTEIIEVGERHRALDGAACDRLAASMREIGLRQAISIRVVDMMVIDGHEVEGVPVLVAGRHRLEAAKRLGWTHIDCIEVDDDSLRAELWEIDENLMRAELTPAQQAEHLARRKEVWEALQTATNCRSFEGRGNKGFATETAKSSGIDKRTVQRDVARAEALGPDLRVIAGTSLDKGVEMDALAKMTPAERQPIIQRAAAGENVTARAPIADHDAVLVQFNTIMSAWNRAGPEARELFLEEIDTPVFDRTRAAQ